MSEDQRLVLDLTWNRIAVGRCPVLEKHRLTLERYGDPKRRTLHKVRFAAIPEIPPWIVGDVDVNLLIRQLNRPCTVEHRHVETESRRDLSNQLLKWSR